MANSAVIAIGMSGLDDGHDRVSIGLIVLAVGLVVGLPVGIYVGALAARGASKPAWARVIVLAVPPILLVALLAATFGMLDYFVVACIPTLVAVVILERSTRKRAAPPVPVARI